MEKEQRGLLQGQARQRLILSLLRDANRQLYAEGSISREQLRQAQLALEEAEP